MVVGQTLVSSSHRPLSNINDSYCVNPTSVPVNLVRLDSESQKTEFSKTLNVVTLKSDVCCHAVSLVPTVHSHGLPQKKGVSPGYCLSKINHVKDVCCVDQCHFVPSVPNVPSAVVEQPVGGRLQEFWHIWQEMGANPRVVSVLRDCYSLPFKQRPRLTRFPLVQSGYANPVKSRSLTEALRSLIGKLVVEKVVVKSSLAFFNRLFLVPKPTGLGRPILHLSQLNLFLQSNTFKMETPETIRLSLQKQEWVTSLDFSDAYFHIPINHRSRKYLRFFLNSQTFQFTALPFGLATAPLEFTKVTKEVKLMAQAKGIRIHQYLDDWLLRARSRETCLQHTQTLLALCQKLGWVVNLKKSELVPQQVFNFVGYRFDLIKGRVLPTQDRWMALEEKLKSIMSKDSCTVRQFMSLVGLLTATEKQVWLGRLHMRAIQWHLKGHWHVPEVLEKVIPVPLSLHHHLGWWLNEQNVLEGQPLHPLQHALQLFTDASNEGWGTHLGDFTARGVWSKPESHLHINFLELKAVLLALKSFEPLCKGHIVLVATDNTTVVSYIIKQGGMRSGSLCALLWRLLSVPPQGNCAESKAHSGPLECDSGQAFQAQPGDSNRVVPFSAGFQSVVLQMAPTTSRFVCDPVQLQTSSVCIAGSGSDSLGGGRPESPVAGSGRLCLPTSVSDRSGGVEDGRSRMSVNDPDCPRLAKHALVLGPRDPVSSDSAQSALGDGSGVTAVQRTSAQESQQSQSACVAPRVMAIQKRGFSEEVAGRIEAPQRVSTRAVYKSKWAIFVKWCKTHTVDFRSPSVTQIADFLLYLFSEKNLQPSTIDGYRTAIADMLGNDSLNISKDENLSRLLDSFHRDRPKGRRGIPSWNLSLVLHQLTKAPFEPLRKASLKHLTFKTVFLLALGSGKRRSEIHAWLYKNIRHQENWSQVSLYPSPGFLSKNQLARDGPASVAPVVIPALAPTLDNSLSEDKSLCPVRALRYYLDRTKDLRTGKDLLSVF